MSFAKHILIIIVLLFPTVSSSEEIISWIEKKPHPMVYNENFFSASSKDLYRSNLELFLLEIPIFIKDFKIKNFGNFQVLYDINNIHPTVIYNTNGDKNLIIEAPHSGFESSTGKQAVMLLEKLNAKVAIISGSHRCASNQYSPCSGGTGVCGVSDEKYRISDSAHSEKNLFQVAHEVSVDFFSESKVVQLHEMRKTTSPHKIILSSTAYAMSNNPNDFVTNVRNNLRSAHNNPSIAVSCNAPDDQILEFRKLCAYSNTQGRFLNGSKNICSEYTEHDSNRFIHIEQDYSTTLLPKFLNAMINALVNIELQ